MAKCDVCNVREAVVYQPHYSRKLCSGCFMEDIKFRIKKQIEKYNMFDKRHKLLLGVSGGKDSFVLLDVLVELHDPSKIIALTIIEGVEGYNRDEEVERVKRYTRGYGVDSIIVSLKEEFGYRLDEIVRLALKSGIDESPCTFCGVLRRRVLNTYARMVNADRTVTAHNLDDEVQTIVINMIRGDYQRLLRGHPLAPKLSERFVHKVKPMREIYEWETALYAYIKGFTFQETECPYINLRPTLRAKIRDILYGLERNSPGALYRILMEYDEMLLDDVKKLYDRPSLPTCRLCGEATSYGRDICKTCEIFENLGVKMLR